MMKMMNKAKAIERLGKVLNEVPELKKISNSPQFDKWLRNAQLAITNTFGNESRHITDFNEAIESLNPALGLFTHDSEFQAYIRGLERAAAILESMIEEIGEYWEEGEKSSGVSNPEVEIPENTNKVFIIHGRDEAARETVARFLENLKLEPVILHEQPNKGRTIIEKFEAYAGVGFAVVLLTPDDKGNLRDDQSKGNLRARQNVVFEFGYFIGKLGRGKVCALVKGDIEKPSDYDGVLYIPMDDKGAWKMELFRELKDAGFDIDTNRTFEL